MVALFTDEQRHQANVLTTAGFLSYYTGLYLAGGVTQEWAYEQTEKVHQAVHLLNKRKYSDFSSFLRLKRAGKNS